MARARRLLRPGGFLVVGEGSVQTTPISSFIFGPLPGWWLGHDDGRLLSPHASAADWDRLLRENGFSGIDTKAPDEWEDVLGVCLFASQAVDDTISLLRSPISDPNPKPELQSSKLVLVGGKTPCVSRLLAEIEKLLGSYAVEIETHRSLSDIDYDSMTNSQAAPTAILSLVDLDVPVFEDMTEEDFFSIQRLFSQERTVLWVTSARRSENPFSNMVVGFGRTAVHETPGLNLQHLDVPELNTRGIANTIAETFLRLVMVPTMADKDLNMTWVVEPEIVVEANGRHRAARLVPLREPNDRYNSGHRPITRETDIGDKPVALCHNGSGLLTLERVAIEKVEPFTETGGLGSPLLSVRVIHAVIPGIRTQLGHMFLAAGMETNTESTYLLLIPRLTSSVRIPATAALLLPANIRSVPETLSYLADHLTALHILRQVLPNQTVAVHNATSSLAEAISLQAATKNVRTVFTMDEGTDHELLTRSYTILPRYISRSELSKLLPDNDMISCFVDMTQQDTSSNNCECLRTSLPAWCRLESASTLYSWKGPRRCTAPEIVVQDLRQAFELSQVCGQKCPRSPVTLHLEQLVNSKQIDHAPYAQDRIAVLDLTTQPRLPVHVKRLDADGVMFKHDKTYWVVGVSGDLGISLCDWMISTGARHLVITSRNPNIDRLWIDSNLRRGVQITIVPWYEIKATLRH